MSVGPNQGKEEKTGERNSSLFPDSYNYSLNHSFTNR